MLSHLWDYREFIFGSVRRSFAAKYKGSVLGALWAVFQPLAMILVYTLVFSNVMKNRLPEMEDVPYAYSIYLCAGVLPWGLFSELLSENASVFLSNANIMKKVAFPRVCLPAIATLSSVVNFLIAFSLFLIFLLLVDHLNWSAFLSFFPLFSVEVLFASSIGVGLGVLNVFFRDVKQLLGVVLQFWFWFTPVVYPETIIPERLRQFFVLNPMYLMIKGYHDIFLYGKSPDFLEILAVFCLSVLIAWASLRLYRRHVGEMVDEL